MPTKKKAKGKANKAANKSKKSEGAAAAKHQAEQTAATNHKTQDDDDFFLEEAIKVAAAEKKELDAAAAAAAATAAGQDKCNHGCDPLLADSDYNGFMKTFIDTFKAGINRRDHALFVIKNAGKAASAKYPDVMKDSTKIGRIVSAFLAAGTDYIMDGDLDSARTNAFITIYFERMSQLLYQPTSMNYAKMIEVLKAEEHTLVSHYRKRISCKCLDKKYKEVKHIAKMGMCSNPECTIPGRMVERKGMLHCIRCREVYYCTRECQVAHWPAHKEACNMYVDRQAAFKAKQKAAK